MYARAISSILRLVLYRLRLGKEIASSGYEEEVPSDSRNQDHNQTIITYESFRSAPNPASLGWRVRLES